MFRSMPSYSTLPRDSLFYLRFSPLFTSLSPHPPPFLFVSRYDFRQDAAFPTRLEPPCKCFFPPPGTLSDLTPVSISGSLEPCPHQNVYNPLFPSPHLEEEPRSSSHRLATNSGDNNVFVTALSPADIFSF